MIQTTSLYETCHELFIRYPLASRTLKGGGMVRSMVLMLRDGGEADYYVLSQNYGERRHSYSVRPWPSGPAVDITVRSDGSVPALVQAAVTLGVPLPRHGSLFGWTLGSAFTALVGVETDYAPHSPEPRWAVMPLAGIAEGLWPPFTDESFFGAWFWEYFAVGRLVSLDDFIARRPGTVFWVRTDPVLGSGCCVVACDIVGPHGRGLRRGAYVYSETLRADKPVPSLQALLADTSKIDLAGRFPRPSHG